MIRTIRILLFCLFGFLLAAPLSFAGFVAGTYSFNELGQGLDPNGNAIPSGIGMDPISGMVTLFYTLPFSAAAGDVLIFEPDSGGKELTDLIRFVQGSSPNTTQMFFFSDGSDEPNPGPADVGLPDPNTFQTNRAFVDEVGSEGDNRATWEPAFGKGDVGDPGFQITYVFISDIPEPGTWGLIAAGGLTLLACRRSKRG